MFSKKFRFFDFVAEIITPEAVDYSGIYSKFICSDGEETSFRAVIEFADSLPEIPENAVDGCDVCHLNTADKSICWYKNHGTNDFFACRISKNREARILVKSQYSGKLWGRVVFGIIGFEEIAAMHGAAVIHASYVEKNGKAVLFTAECGVGKSTQAELWRRHADARIINGDKALITLKNGRATAGGLPFSGSSEYCENAECEIAAVVCLGQAKENSLSVLDGREAVFELLKGCYRPMQTGLFENNVSVLTKISDCVTVFRLDCLPDKSAVEILEKELCF